VDQVRWYEPAGFGRAWRERLHGPPNRGSQLRLLFAIAGVVLAVFLVSYLVGYFVHGKTEPVIPWWGWFACAFGVGFILAYVIPFLTSMGSAEVRILERGIGRKSSVGVGVQIETWLWEQIASCSIEEMELGGQRFRVLMLHAPDSGSYPIGLDNVVSVEAIESALRAHGKELVVRT